MYVINVCKRQVPPRPACGRLLPRSRPASGDGTARQLDVKRPTLSCDLRRVVRSQSAVWRLDVKVTANWEADFADAQQPGFRAVSRINRLAVYSISDSK